MKQLLFAATTVLAAILGAVPIAAAEIARPATTAADAATTFDFPAAGETRVIGIPEVKSLLKDHQSDLMVVNFWATWCSPCIAELPYFVRVSREYPEDRVRVVGLSVDLKREVESKVIPFLRKREIPYSNLVAFADQADLIRVFSEKWEGDVPATFLYDREGNRVAEVLDELTYEELKALVEKHLPAQD